MKRPQIQIRKHIYLLGLSGSGKSTVGARLAARKARRFIDTDKVIATRFRTSIACLFERYGEQRFRREETAVIRHIARLKELSVVALGGGAVERSVNRRLVRQSGIAVYLRCSLRELGRRLRNTQERPLLGTGETKSEKLREMLARRKPMYETADITVSTTHHTVGAVVKKIVKRLEEYERANRR